MPGENLAQLTSLQGPANGGYCHISINNEATSSYFIMATFSLNCIAQKKKRQLIHSKGNLSEYFLIGSSMSSLLLLKSMKGRPKYRAKDTLLNATTFTWGVLFSV